MNTFFISNSSRTKLPLDLALSSGGQSRVFINKSWNITSFSNNETNNPIVDLFISLSQPCGLRAEHYQ
jgi:hypothetical protein